MSYKQKLEKDNKRIIFCAIELSDLCFVFHRSTYCIIFILLQFFKVFYDD